MKKLLPFFFFNSFNAKVAIILKPVNWFALQINWRVSIWWWIWHLMSYYFRYRTWRCSTILFLFTCGQRLWKVHTKVFILSKFESLFDSTFNKNEFFHGYFSSVEYIFWRTALGGSNHFSYRTHLNGTKKNKTTKIFYLPSQFF